MEENSRQKRKRKVSSRFKETNLDKKLGIGESNVQNEQEAPKKRRGNRSSKTQKMEFSFENLTDYSVISEDQDPKISVFREERVISFQKSSKEEFFGELLVTLSKEDHLTSFFQHSIFTQSDYGSDRQTKLSISLQALQSFFNKLDANSFFLQMNQIICEMLNLEDNKSTERKEFFFDLLSLFCLHFQQHLSSLFQPILSFLARKANHYTPFSPPFPSFLIINPK